MKIIFKSQFIRFAIVGILSTLIHSGVYLSTLNILKLNAQLSNMVGFGVAFIASYVGQRFWTFREVKIKNKRRSQFKFLISASFSYLLNSLWVFVVEVAFKISPKYAIVGIVFITPLITFIVLKMWVFRSED